MYSCLVALIRSLVLVLAVIPSSVLASNVLMSVLVDDANLSEVVSGYDNRVNQSQNHVFNYVFDEKMLIGTSLEGVSLDALNSEEIILPGAHRVDIYLNGVLRGRKDIDFIATTEAVNAEPCMTEKLLVKELSVKPLTQGEGLSTECVQIARLLPGASVKFNSGELRLDLSIPHAYLDVKPFDYVSQDEWDAGETMFFVNYDANAYHSEYRDAGGASYAYGALASGLNFGLWRFRNFSSINYTRFNGNGTQEFNSLRTYVQRAIPGLSSELTLGENYTGGNLFGSLSYRGVSLATDERMLPSSRVGYAPEIRGTASTPARVIIRQQGNIIKEVSVAPGPFIIDDIIGYASAGDLNVEVVEADGAVSTFTVPYSAVPESMRPGQSRYSLTLGELRDFNIENEFFLDAIYQLGINNSLTANTGLRMADDYMAILGGGVFATSYGAFGVNGIYSNSVAEDNKRKQGWRIGLNYSKTIDLTNTNISLAGYRYSTVGFRELTDVVGSRSFARDGEVWDSPTLNQRNQVSLLINQHLGSYGSLYVSASVSDYHGRKSRDTQLQAGYSNRWKDLNYSLSWSRQNTFFAQDYLGGVGTGYNAGKKTNTFTLSLSLPLGRSRNSPYVSSSVSRSMGDINNHTVQSGISGSIGERQQWNYALSANHDKLMSETFWNANVGTNTPVARLHAGYSQGSNYRQYNGSASGAVVVHQGGVTFGPRLSETFGLIEAKGAEGALVHGSSGARIDRNGYALVSSVTPYRYNSLSLSPENINYHTELLESERKVAPYAGSSVKVTFETITGYPVIISSQQANGRPVPLGASVFTPNRAEVGMVGQGGQIYARVSNPKDSLVVKWGGADHEQCTLQYSFEPMEIDESDFYKASALCHSTITAR